MLFFYHQFDFENVHMTKRKEKYEHRWKYLVNNWTILHHHHTSKSIATHSISNIFFNKIDPWEMKHEMDIYSDLILLLFYFIWYYWRLLFFLWWHTSCICANRFMIRCISVCDKCLNCLYFSCSISYITLSHTFVQFLSIQKHVL